MMGVETMLEKDWLSSVTSLVITLLLYTVPTPIQTENAA